MTDRYRCATRSFATSSLNASLFLLLALIAILLGPSAGQAQSTSPFGRQFFIAFPDTVQHHAPRASGANLRPMNRLVLFSFDTALVRVHNYGFDRLVTVYPQKSIVLDVPPLYINEPGKLTQDIFEVNATRDIGVYVYYTTPYGSEGYTALPVESWGNEYFVASMGADSLHDIAYASGESEESFRYFFTGPQFVVIASQLTNVTIRSRIDVGGLKLRRLQMLPGDAVLLTGDIPGDITPQSPSFDISGTHITADRPIGVISGNARSQGGGHFGADLADIGSPLKNAIIEWLSPTRAHGTRFAYRPVSIVEPSKTRELVRVYGTAPGKTAVRRPHLGRIDSVDQGSFLQFIATQPPTQIANVPFAITTDKPAQAMVVTGPYAQIVDTFAVNDFAYLLWGAAMSELMPYERWITLGRIHSHDYPLNLEHYIAIVADSNATVWLDGKEIDFGTQVVPGSTFRHTREKVGSGDHTLVSSNGKFNAIAYGQGVGYQEYKPVGARRDDDDDRALLRPHPSVYIERMAVAYAYPVAGVGTYGSDSLELSRIEDCDSTVAVIERPAGKWVVLRLSAEVQADSVNADIRIDSLVQAGIHSGFRIRFRPVDPQLDAHALVIVTNESGKRWEIPYDYSPDVLTILPDPFELHNVSRNTLRTANLVLTNNTRGRVLTVLSARLLDGSAGFSLPSPLPFPKDLGALENMPLAISFIGAEAGKTYVDTLIVETECGIVVVPLWANTRSTVTTPNPGLTDYDWGPRWLTPLNACTKGDTLAYEGMIIISNSGEAPYNIISLELMGPDVDAGIFEFGPNPTLAPGDRVDPGAQLPQQVLFKPRDERGYSCLVRLIASSGDTVMSTLTGVGIESHVRVTDNDFGRSPFQSGLQVPGTVVVAALPTRALTVRGLQIVGPNAAEFIFAQGFVPPNPVDPSTWWRLDPGASRQVPLVFAPASSGDRVAELQVIGDHAHCDDSTGALAGSTFVEFAEVLGDTMVSCVDSTGFLTISNRSAVGIQVADIVLQDLNGGFFSIDRAGLPFVLGPGESQQVPVAFTPTAAGSFTATALVLLRSADGTLELGSIEAQLLGLRTVRIVPASIGRDYVVEPGDNVTVQVMLDGALDAAQVTELTIAVQFNGNMLLLHNITQQGLAMMVAGTRLAGWGVALEELKRGSFRARFTAPPGTYLQGTGPLLNLEFRTFLANTLESELPFTIAATGNACVEVITTPGLIRLDSVCGLRSRLIELTDAGYALDQNRPNPFNPGTDIEFEIGLDAPTTLVIYNAAGAPVATLVDEHLQPGRYSITWNAMDHPSGLYYCRLVSGEWRGEIRMVLVK